MGGTFLPLGLFLAISGPNINFRAYVPFRFLLCSSSRFQRGMTRPTPTKFIFRAYRRGGPFSGGPKMTLPTIVKLRELIFVFFGPLVTIKSKNQRMNIQIEQRQFQRHLLLHYYQNINGHLQNTSKALTAEEDEFLREGRSDLKKKFRIIV